MPHAEHTDNMSSAPTVNGVVENKSAFISVSLFYR